MYSYEDAGDEDDPQLVGLPAIIKLAGIKLTVRRKLVIKKNKPMPKFTSATVTPLVRANGPGKGRGGRKRKQG